MSTIVRLLNAPLDSSFSFGFIGFCDILVSFLHVGRVLGLGGVVAD